MRTRFRLSLAVFIVGVVLVAASFIWPTMVGGKAAWSDERAAAYQDAARELHRLTYDARAAQELVEKQSASGNPQAAFADKQLAAAAKGAMTGGGSKIRPATKAGTSTPEDGASIDSSAASADRLTSQLEAAKESYRVQREALDSARSRGSGTASAMFWIGLVAAAIGLCSLAATAGQESED